MNAQSAVRLTGTISGRDMTLNFPSTGGCRYRLEMTGDLKTSVWEPLLYNIVGDGTEKSNRFNMGTVSNGFYRLRLITE